MNVQRRHVDYARQAKPKLDDGFVTIPEMTIYSMLPAKVFDKGPSLAVALGICVGLSFGVGILSGWYSYRSTDSQAKALWSHVQLDKVADATARHRARIQPAALTFFDELRQPTQKEQMKLEKAAPPKHVVAALDAQIPVNLGEKNESQKREKASKDVPVALVAASDLGVNSKASVQADVKEDRGVEMASALARLLGEPVDDGFEPQSAPTPKTLSSANAPLDLKAWGIQTSVFSEKYSATSLVDHLRSKGYQARLSRKGDAGYTVFVSGFKGENAALTAQERLSKEEGLSSFLVRP